MFVVPPFEHRMKASYWQAILQKRADLLPELRMGMAVAVTFAGDDPQARLIGTASGAQHPSLLQRDGFVALAVNDEEVCL
jgi:hypothetical protein